MYTCLGLGDTNYDKFCAASKMIVKRLNELGAKSFYTPGYADEAIGLESVVDPWLQNLYPQIQGYYKSLKTTTITTIIPVETSASVSSLAEGTNTSAPSTVPSLSTSVPMAILSTVSVPSSTPSIPSVHLPMHISIPNAIEHITNASNMNELSPMTFMKATQAIQEERVKRRKSSVGAIPTDGNDTVATNPNSSNNNNNDSNDSNYHNHSPTVVHLHPQQLPPRARSRGNSIENTLHAAGNNDIILDTSGKTNDQIIEEAALIAASTQTNLSNHSLPPVLPPLHIPPSLSTSSLVSLQNAPMEATSSSASDAMNFLPYQTITPLLTPGVKSFSQLFPNITIPPANESTSKKLFPPLPKNILSIKTVDKDTTALINAAVEISLASSSSSSLSTSINSSMAVHTPPGTVNNNLLSPAGFSSTNLIGKVPRVPSGIGLSTPGTGNTSNSGHNSPGRTGGGIGNHPVIGRSIDAPIQGSIQNVRYLTTGNHESNRRVIHMEINVENTPLVGNWHPGDSISILTPNPDDLCFGICSRLNLDPFHRIEITEAAANTSPDASSKPGTINSSSSTESIGTNPSNYATCSPPLVPALPLPIPPVSHSSPLLLPNNVNGLPPSPSIPSLPSTTPVSRIPIYLPNWLSGYPYPLIIDIFRWCVDLTSPPKKNILRLLGEYCAPDHPHYNDDRNLLMYLASTNGKTVFQTLIEEQRLTFLDLLLLFPSSLPPLTTLLSSFPPLAPRSYSLASSPLENRNIMAIAFTVVHYECMASTLLMNKGTTNSVNQANGIIATTMLDNMPTPSPLPDEEEYSSNPSAPTTGTSNPGSNGSTVSSSSERMTIHRKGIATSYLEHVSLPYLKGTATLSFNNRPKLRLFLRPARDFFPPVSLQTPMIMIGPGTGVAPFRGFLQHRAAMIKRQLHDAVAICRGIYKPGLYIKDVTDTDILNSTYLGNSLLFFGNRSPEIDFLYQEEFEKYRLPVSNHSTEKNQVCHSEFIYSTEPIPLTNQVTVLSAFYTAWSRYNPSNKVYVQHRLREQGAIIADLILHRGAHVYVCGDGMQMAKDVHQALIDILVQYGHSTKNNNNDNYPIVTTTSVSKQQEIWTTALVEEKLQKLTKEGRYAKDVWA